MLAGKIHAGTSLAVLAACSLIAADAAAQRTAQAPVQLDAISVTANKRPQALGEVDGAVSIRTGEELEEAGVTRVEELEKVFAGLKINTRGNRAYANVTVRGVTSPDFYNPAVQIYVDGVPQDAAAFTQELVNVDRVELLRGPQGTLYGRNAHGGVINIITRKPADRVSGHVAGTLSTGEHRAEASLSAPLVPGMLSGGVDLRWSHQLGQVTDTATGREDFDHATSKVGRLKLRYAPTGGPLDVTLSAQQEKLRSHEELYIRDSLLQARQFSTATQGVEPVLDRQVNTYGLTVDYDFGGARLTSVSAMLDRDLMRELSGRKSPETQESWSEELRLSFGEGKRLSGVVGGFYQDSEFDRRTAASSASGVSRNVVGAKSTALFGESTYRITDALDATAGIRWSREEVEINFNRVTPNALAFQSSDSFEDISPKLALGYDLTPDSRVYGVVSRGFKPGGFNHTVAIANDRFAYGSETSTNYEIGWRGALMDGRFELGAAAYWIEAKDKQIYVGPLGAQVLRNLGDAESRGIELDAKIRATNALSFDLGLALGQSSFRDARDPTTGANYSDNRLPYAPDRTINAGFRYIFAQTALPGELSLAGAGRFVSTTYFNETNTLSQQGYRIFDAAIDLNLDSGYRFSLFVDNITDEVYRTSSFSFGANDNRSTIGEGRLIGVTVRKSF